MMAVGDTVGAGLVASLARPVATLRVPLFPGPQIYAKQLELFRETVPRVARVAVLTDPDGQSDRAWRIWRCTSGMKRSAHW
jgi:putative ABC transport system substrate-binding protein